MLAQRRGQHGSPFVLRAGTHRAADAVTISCGVVWLMPRCSVFSFPAVDTDNQRGRVVIERSSASRASAQPYGASSI
jgi:hypothetical protein